MKTAISKDEYEMRKQFLIDMMSAMYSKIGGAESVNAIVCFKDCLDNKKYNKARQMIKGMFDELKVSLDIVKSYEQ